MSAGYQRRKPRFPRLLLGAFVLLSCLRAWVGAPPLVDEARAQIPDSGRQLNLLIEESRRTNLLLADIKQILSSRTLNVRIRGADNTSADN